MRTRQENEEITQILSNFEDEIKKSNQTNSRICPESDNFDKKLSL